MPFFVRSSPRPEGSPSPSTPSRFSSLQFNVRALLGNPTSPQQDPEVAPSPVRHTSEPVETPKLPPLDFLRASQGESDFVLPSGRQSEDRRSRRPSRSNSQRTVRSLRNRSLSRTRSRRSTRGQTSDSESRPSNVGPRPSNVGTRPSFQQSEGRVTHYQPPLPTPQPPHGSTRSQEALPFHPADTAAAEARSGVSPAAPAPVLIAHGNYDYSAVNEYNHDLERGYSNTDSEYSQYVDPETGELDAIVNRRRRRRHRDNRHRPRRHRAWTRSPQERRRCCGFVQGEYARRKLVWLITSGGLLITALAVYLGLAITQPNLPQSIHVLFILAILAITIFFAHSLVRLIMIILNPYDERDHPRVPDMTGPEGFKPVRPIRVHLARDEELADDFGSGSSEQSSNSSDNGHGAEDQQKPAPPPPAYGLWRSSVRVDPNLIHWAPRSSVMGFSSVDGNSEANGSTSSPVNVSPTMDRVDEETRPPSYVSDEGVEYVIGAEPRNTVYNPPDGYGEQPMAPTAYSQH